MDKGLLEVLYQQNPWLNKAGQAIAAEESYIQRLQFDFLLLPDWDSLWTILIGPRQSGKTTIGKHLCQNLIVKKRYKQLLYLNCDYLEIRHWLTSASFLSDAETFFELENYILFIDEVQRLENPGLILKIIADLKRPIKMIATGSSQLEIKSKVQEYLTGRQLEALILPLSCREIEFKKSLPAILQYGSYPQVFIASQKEVILQELFKTYIQKDIVEILKVGKPDVMQYLLALLAHSSGQLINYQQLSIDCKVNVETVRNYMDILEKTYVIKIIKPFVGNKRTEITSNPICYFIDIGFRNQALNNFSPIESRADNGLLVESLVFQELYKFQSQERASWQLHYWRTKSGAEVDFVIKIDFETVIPVEVKYRNLRNMALTRSYKSFIDAYNPKVGFFITKNQRGMLEYKNTRVYFFSIDDLPVFIEKIKALFEVD